MNFILNSKSVKYNFHSLRHYLILQMYDFISNILDDLYFIVHTA